MKWPDKFYVIKGLILLNYNEIILIGINLCAYNDFYVTAFKHTIL